MKYHSKLALLLLIGTLSQVSYSKVKENVERDITENPFEIIESEGFADVNNSKKEGLTISGGIGPQFIYEYKNEKMWGENKSYQYSPFLGYFSLPDYGFSTTFEIKRAINKWTSKGSSEEQVNKSWEYEFNPRYYIGYYLGAPTDLIGNITIMDQDQHGGGTYKEFEYSIGLAQSRKNLYSEIKVGRKTIEVKNKWDDETQETNIYEMTLKPYIQRDKFQYEIELYGLYEDYWKSKENWTESYLELHATPGIIYDFGGGKKLSFRTELGKKTEKYVKSTREVDTYYWKATLGYEFMVTENIAGLIELEYERDSKKPNNSAEEKISIKKVTAALNYRF